jgi:hypothetical protein
MFGIGLTQRRVLLCGVKSFPEIAWGPAVRSFREVLRDTNDEDKEAITNKRRDKHP